MRRMLELEHEALYEFTRSFITVGSAIVDKPSFCLTCIRLICMFVGVHKLNLTIVVGKMHENVDCRAQYAHESPRMAVAASQRCFPIVLLASNSEMPSSLYFKCRAGYKKYGDVTALTARPSNVRCCGRLLDTNELCAPALSRSARNRRLPSISSWFSARRVEIYWEHVSRSDSDAATLASAACFRPSRSRRLKPKPSCVSLAALRAPLWTREEFNFCIQIRHCMQRKLFRALNYGFNIHTSPCLGYNILAVAALAFHFFLKQCFLTYTLCVRTRSSGLNS